MAASLQRPQASPRAPRPAGPGVSDVHLLSPWVAGTLLLWGPYLIALSGSLSSGCPCSGPYLGLMTAMCFGILNLTTHAPTAVLPGCAVPRARRSTNGTSTKPCCGHPSRTSPISGAARSPGSINAAAHCILASGSSAADAERAAAGGRESAARMSSHATDICFRGLAFASDGVPGPGSQRPAACVQRLCRRGRGKRTLHALPLRPCMPSLPSPLIWTWPPHCCCFRMHLGRQVRQC